MPQFVIIGLAAGIASAALFASASAGGMGARLPLFFLAPLPLFLAGLGWGAVSAVCGALAAALGLSLLFNVKSGALVLISQGLPAVLLCYLALLSRTHTPSAAPGEGSSATSNIEWYPVGRLVAVAALIAGALAMTSLFQLGLDLDEARTLLKDLLDKVFLKQMPGFKDRKIEASELEQLTEIALYAFPAVAGLLWLAGFLLNLYLAGRITLASGRLPRPWPDIASMTFPRGFALLLAATLAVSVSATGLPALAGSGFAGALFFAFTVMGLAVVHELTRGQKARPVILLTVYVILIILNAWVGALLALLGVLEPLLPWRRRPLSPPSSPSS